MQISLIIVVIVGGEHYFYKMVESSFAVITSVIKQMIYLVLKIPTLLYTIATTISFITSCYLMLYKVIITIINYTIITITSIIVINIVIIDYYFIISKH
jgi:hypothetical protein